MTNSRADGHKSWMVGCLFLVLWDFSRSNKHCIQLSTTNTIYIYLTSLLQYLNFRSSLLELFCKSGVLKNFEKFTSAFSSTGVSCEFCEILKNTFFHITPYSRCFWHLHQSRFPILILYVINRQLRHMFSFFSMEKRKTSFSHAFSSE